VDQVNLNGKEKNEGITPFWLIIQLVLCKEKNEGITPCG
jgi:hypothetical protein